MPHNPTPEDINNALTTHSNTVRNQWAQQAHQAMDDHLTEQHNTTLAALTPPPPEPAPPLPKALLDLLNKHPSPNLDGLL